MSGSSRLRQGGTTHQILVASIRERHSCPSTTGKEAILEQGYWLRRKREELALAWKSTSARARLIHFDLVGRYSVKAANTGEAIPPFTAHRKVPEA